MRSSGQDLQYSEVVLVKFHLVDFDCGSPRGDYLAYVTSQSEIAGSGEYHENSGPIARTLRIQITLYELAAPGRANNNLKLFYVDPVLLRWTADSRGRLSRLCNHMDVLRGGWKVSIGLSREQNRYGYNTQNSDYLIGISCRGQGLR